MNMDNFKKSFKSRDKGFYTKNSFLKDFFYEIKKIKNILINCEKCGFNKKLDLDDIPREIDNPNATKMYRILTNLENIIICDAIKKY